jgi:hypothetical protein
MKSQGVEAYFSGCLTLTLEPNPLIEKHGYILCVDASDAVTNKIKYFTSRPVFELSPMWHAHSTFSERICHAKIYLKKIQQAHCVITRRLHCALPAIALGTPVIFIADLSYNTVQERCSDYLPFLHTLSPDDFCQLPPNLECLKVSSSHARIKSDLIKRCSAFTGFDRCESLIPNSSDDDDLFILLKAMQKAKNDMRALQWMSNKRILKLLMQRLFKRRQWWNIID